MPKRAIFEDGGTTFQITAEGALQTHDTYYDGTHQLVQPDELEDFITWLTEEYARLRKEKAEADRG